MTSNKGFSFVEILIALMVITVSGVGSMKLYSYMEQLKGNAVGSLRAQQLAQQQVSLLQTVNTQDSECREGAEGNVTFDNVGTCLISLTELNESKYKVETEVVNTIEESGTVYGKLIEVKVTWSDRHGGSQEIKLLTMVSKFSNLTV
ncbi:typIV pilin [Veronia nyctiphanis]|uniref:TypIV pilin n=1 Tax=Veronia nyctiphanis TaxID=1278244 RepID=A0A4Q0YRP3_9GAMM|nr:prepilin-type N-terminal cleavage/methylation domain-containing protein [Veronia nyctiphanis]RXJ73857.1 typIV pilin [Veronia nyctiphanis]